MLQLIFTSITVVGLLAAGITDLQAYLPVLNIYVEEVKDSQDQ